MSYSKTLETDLANIRRSSIKLREQRLKLDEVTDPTQAQVEERERLRVELNKNRKQERFIKGRIDQLNGRTKK